MECIICAEYIDSVARLSTFGACNHCDICSVCFLRIRALQRKFACPTCKTELDKIICCKESNKKFEDFSIWGDSIGDGYTYDERSQIFFPKEYFKEKIEPLFRFQCKVCRQTRRDFKSLKGHLGAEHKLSMCQLCIDFKQVFPAEQIYYSQKDFEKHMRHGDADGSIGHPMCEFCRTRYYDSTALFIHLSKDHYTCHLCEKMG